MKRRAFLSGLPLTAIACAHATAQAPSTTASPAGAPACDGCVSTVTGPLRPESLGVTLIHEHVLVDFVGADRVSRDRYDAEEVFRVALPHLVALRAAGCQTLVECTPSFLGRDPSLLRRLSDAAGLQLVTNTGYYGAADDKYLPEHAYRETADQLAARWTAEFRDGIEGTGIRPGFLKTGVDAGPLSEIDRKLIVAAGRCHLATGLAVCVHTGNGQAALEVLETLKQEGVAPSAYVWVHAQNERDRSVHLRVAGEGAWVEFDGVRPESLEAHVEAVTDLIAGGHLGRVLVSQDAGWYHVGEAGGGTYRGYRFLFDSFLPALRGRGASDAQVRRLVVDNPAEALTTGVRRLA
jgi:phosphotriesterase-related protein